MLAMRILKPEKPSYILAGTHGWHMSIEDFEPLDRPKQGLEYLTIQVDMRGRAFSEGSPDCNGWELYDVIDAVNYVREHYQDYIADPEIVYFESGSGGGGNAYGIIGKFPDFFSAATALYGITDYGSWYEEDAEGEFRDEMTVWVGGNPQNNTMAYRSRGGIYLLENLQTPLFIGHGDSDRRVPVEHARRYVKRAEELGKSHLIRYMELEGVGDGGHMEHATIEQVKNLEDESERNRKMNRRPVEIPAKGKMTIAGYLITRKFAVFLDSIDKVANLEYDLENGTFEVYSDVNCGYGIKIF